MVAKKKFVTATIDGDLVDKLNAYLDNEAKRTGSKLSRAAWIEDAIRKKLLPILQAASDGIKVEA